MNMVVKGSKTHVKAYLKSEDVSVSTNVRKSEELDKNTYICVSRAFAAFLDR